MCNEQVAGDNSTVGVIVRNVKLGRLLVAAPTTTWCQREGDSFTVVCWFQAASTIMNHVLRRMAEWFGITRL